MQEIILASCIALITAAMTLNITSPDKLHEYGNKDVKKEIIGLIYPKKLTFDRFYYPTAKLDETVRLIYYMGKGFRQNKNEQTEVTFDLSNV